MADTQLHAFINFANYHLNYNNDWMRVLFNDESMFSFDGNNIWLLIKSGEVNQPIFHTKKKYNQRIIVFGRISYLNTIPLILIEGTLDSGSYCDECIDGTGLIIDMNSTYGVRNWTLMQDRAIIHI